MTDSEMSLELCQNKVDDNPFDIMLFQSLELARDLLFACHRFKNPGILGCLSINKENLEFRMDAILSEFSKLSNMSDETVGMCRETSYYYHQDKFEEMNRFLLKFERNLQTIYTKCVPNRNDRFEQIRLGKDSPQYKRLLELRDIIDNSEELSSVNDDYLYSLTDVISRPDECLKCWMSQEEVEQKQQIVQKYNLSEDDIEYMVSYKNSKK